MKKVFLCAALTVCVSVIGFSQDKTQLPPVDLWFSTGAAFGNYFINGTHVENDYIGSPGINLSFYSLFGPKKIGIFFNFGILFPVINSSGEKMSLPVQLDFILAGFGFGYDINESLKLHLGIGPHLTLINFVKNADIETSVTDIMLGLGLGGDIGIKYNLTKLVSIDLGATLAYNFAVFNEISTEIKGDDSWRHIKTETSGWNNINSIIGIRPYIAAGFNF